ncbi:MAG: hypothetical protein JWO94_3028, partial [Verrucomicrobiaceae bacterium]|nr:hypothetical protein [Verrucomicrobiaceae bacterium]
VGCSLMNVPPFVFALAWLAIASHSVLAQSAGADVSRRVATVLPPTVPSVDGTASLSDRTISEENAFAPGSPGDDDIGQQLILKQVPKNDPFHFSADGYVFYTNNAANTSAGERRDTFFGWRAAAAFQPKITNRLFADVSVSEDWFRYNDLNELDFESFDASASLLYAMPELADSLLFAGYRYNRITNDFDSLLNDHSVRAGIQKTVLIDRRNSIGLGLMGSWDLQSDVPAIKRDEYSADVGWRFKLFPNLQFSLGYRSTYFDYAEAGRGDNLHNLAFGVSYVPWKNCEVYLSATYSFNHSNFAVYDYNAANLGGGLGVRFKF